MGGGFSSRCVFTVWQAHVTVDPFAGDGPVEDAVALSKRLEQETKLLVHHLDTFAGQASARGGDPDGVCAAGHLGKDDATVCGRVQSDAATLLLCTVARWCEECVSVVKVIEPKGDAAARAGSWRDEGSRRDPDATDRDHAPAPYHVQQQDSDVLLSVWQVRERVCLHGDLGGVRE